MKKRIRLGVDVGGTFTDFVLVDEARDMIFTGKQLTTPKDPSAAILDGIGRLLSESGLVPSDVDNIVHGTTLVTNTIIERTGAKVGLISTQGHRDTLEMAKEIRYDLYDLFIESPPSLVPRFLRESVAERISPDGEVLLEFDEKGFRNSIKNFVQIENIEALAICLMHSYRNPIHEQLAKKLVNEMYADLPVTLSSDVAPEIREFERMSTACANAYVQPLMQSYLQRLDEKLKKLGHDGSLYIMLSGGGITTIRDAVAYPIRLIESGPAAGAMAASYYSTLTASKNLISYDMGGTTAKMCLIDNNRPDRKYDFEAGRVRRFAKGSGLPLKVSVVDMIEIGAGGGSLATVSQMGLLKVGPRSAGSQPGPVCYGQGGQDPTVTDADLYLGYLNPDYFLGGKMTLNLEEVEKSIEQKLAKPLGLTALEAAIGIHNVVNENMAAATRMHLAEKGRDPRKYDMIAFGGAGPVHACNMGRLLKLDNVIVPLGAGVTSALGFLVAAPAVDYVRSYVSLLEQIDWEYLNQLFGDMEDEATSLLIEAGAKESDIIFERKADMRYVGQGFEISVPVPNGQLSGSSIDELRLKFFDIYRKLFERVVSDVAIETMSWRLAAVAQVPNMALNFKGKQGTMGGKLKGQRSVFFPETGFAPCDVYDRYAFSVGDCVEGPAIIEERESTTVMPPRTRANIDGSFNLRIELNA